MRIIDEWREAYKFFSVQANGIGMAIIGAYAALPDKFQDVFPSKVVMGAAAICFALGIWGRLVKQSERQEVETRK